MPEVLAVLLGFAIMGTLLILRLPIWVALIATATATSVIASGVEGIINMFTLTTIDTTTLNLLIITLLIAVFINLYKNTGYIDYLSRELIKVLKKARLALALIPAILGLLPVAGGALMSAPIVDSIGNSIGLRRDSKLFINVWYRHVISLFYPISNVMILTAALSGVSVWEIAYRQLPVAAVMITAGLIIGFRRESSRHQLDEITKACEVPDFTLLIKAFTPIIVAVSLSIALTPVVNYVTIAQFQGQSLSIVIGVALALLTLLLLSMPRKDVFLNSLLNKNTAELVLAAYGAMLLRTAFIRAGIGSIISGTLSGFVSPSFLAISLPAALAFITGTSLGSIAISLPILGSLTDLTPSLTALVYTSAFSGYLPSPLHLCYVYTAQYLKISPTAGYKYMIPAIALVMFAAYGIYVLAASS